MEIVIAEQGAFAYEPAVTAEEARGRASAHKAAVFGTLSRLFSRPKDDDIAITDQELRYLPVWHARAYLHFVYDRHDTYKVPVRTPHAATVTVGESDYAVKGGSIELAIVEHCERDQQKELWLDAITDQPVNAQSYGKAALTQVDLAQFTPEGAKIVAPVVRASAVIRALLGDDFRPTDADDIKEETVNVECIDLCLRPVYNFKCVWAAKSKTAELTIDAVTGEAVTQPSAAMAAVSKLMKPETLFDLGAETINVIVPGGAIALKVVKALSEKRKT
jgi:hypothetical protein